MLPELHELLRQVTMLPLITHDMKARMIDSALLGIHATWQCLGATF